MKVMVFVKATAASEAGVMPTQELLTALVRRMEAVQATAAEAGDDLYRFRKGEV